MGDKLVFPGTICTADEWNEKYPIGTKVIAHSEWTRNNPFHTETTSEAWSIGHSDMLKRDTVMVSIRHWRESGDDEGWTVAFLQVVE